MPVAAGDVVVSAERFLAGRAHPPGDPRNPSRRAPPSGRICAAWARPAGRIVLVGPEGNEGVARALAFLRDEGCGPDGPGGRGDQPDHPGAPPGRARASSSSSGPTPRALDRAARQARRLSSLPPLPVGPPRSSGRGRGASARRSSDRRRPRRPARMPPGRVRRGLHQGLPGRRGAPVLPLRTEPWSWRSVECAGIVAVLRGVSRTAFLSRLDEGDARPGSPSTPTNSPRRPRHEAPVRARPSWPPEDLADARAFSPGRGVLGTLPCPSPPTARTSGTSGGSIRTGPRSRSAWTGTEAAAAWLRSRPGSDSRGRGTRAGHYPEAACPASRASVKDRVRAGGASSRSKKLPGRLPRGLRTALDERDSGSLRPRGPRAAALAAELGKGRLGPGDLLRRGRLRSRPGGGPRRAIARTDADLEAARPPRRPGCAARRGSPCRAGTSPWCPRASAEALLADRDPAVVEPYDDRLYLVRPCGGRPDPGAPGPGRDELAARERKLEDEVLAAPLGPASRAALPEIRAVLGADPGPRPGPGPGPARAGPGLGPAGPPPTADSGAHGRAASRPARRTRDLGLTYTPLDAPGSTAGDHDLRVQHGRQDRGS
ncbi:MAG: hypothetical protein MZU97_12535 [Bacillus subtilis]|nr:hypothetical protein [Bacillus subtilis]